MWGPTFLLFFLSINSVFSQGISNLWLLGNYSVSGRPWGGTFINFNGGNADTSYEFREMNLSQTNVSICDSNGNLLFYSNGVYVANALGDTMLNGSGLNPSSYTTTWAQYGLAISQANLIIPIPNDSVRYYLIHETLEFTSTAYHTFEILYSIIDMSHDGGKGAVVQKNIPIIQDTLVCNGLTACRHANGRDWWILFHQYNTDVWYTLLITPDGIQGPFTQNYGPVAMDLYDGQTAFSPDGSKYARCQPNNGLDIYDFDRCTGLLSNNIHVDFNETSSGEGTSFSPSSKILYINFDSHLYQFDLTAADIPASLDTIGTFDLFYDPLPPLYTTFYLSQLAPDGKIYINTGNGTWWLHVINNPDSLGLACDFQQHSFRLPSYNAFSIPNHPNYFLQAQGGTVCDSLGLPNEVQDYIDSYPKLTLYPNPVNSKNVTVTYPALPEGSTLSILNIEGKVLAKYEIPPWSTVQNLTLPEIAPGMYFLEMKSKQVLLYSKVVVQ